MKEINSWDNSHIQHVFQQLKPHVKQMLFADVLDDAP